MVTNSGNEKQARNLSRFPACDSKGRREVKRDVKFMRDIFTCMRVSWSDCQRLNRWVRRSDLKLGENIQGIGF